MYLSEMSRLSFFLSICSSGRSPGNTSIKEMKVAGRQRERRRYPLSHVFVGGDARCWTDWRGGRATPQSVSEI